jgi:parallel beta-helix repeat protein
MKSSPKSKIIILIALGIVFALLPIITSNLFIDAGNNKTSLEYDDDINLDNKNLKILATSGRIHIINNSGWVAFKNDGNCTGEGTYSEPYVIEDLVIDGGGSGSCILIENSDVYFKIENCTVYSSGVSFFYAGIRLLNVNNSLIITNNCSSNNNGIYLNNSNNNTVSGNTANDNYYGIRIGDSNNNTILGNIMNECGLYLSGNLEMLNSLIIDTTNLVNGKPLYYYLNEINLGPNNFTNAGQVILVSCTDSLISNLNTSKCSTGISLHYCNNNNISGNTANNNSRGIYLYNSNNNTVSGNTANDNYYGIYLYNSNNNTVSGNTVYNNFWEGIYLQHSDYNTILGNTANYNYYGILLSESYSNTISGNTANGNYYGIRIHISILNTISGNTANNNTYGICLKHSHSNTISGNTANNNTYGICLQHSCFNTISENTANNNSRGIYLYYSNNNIISKNTLLGNDECIVEDNCEGNIFENDDCGEEFPFELFIIVISIISGGALSVAIILISKKLKKS